MPANPVLEATGLAIAITMVRLRLSGLNLSNISKIESFVILLQKGDQ
jgi:hypothetical protein